jgi:hypothetical protein
MYNIHKYSVQSSSTIDPLHWHLVKLSLLMVRETSPNLVSLNFSKLCVPYRCKTWLKIFRDVLIRDVLVRLTHVKNVYHTKVKIPNTTNTGFPRNSAKFTVGNPAESMEFREVTLPHEIPSSVELANHFRYRVFAV